MKNFFIHKAKHIYNHLMNSIEYNEKRLLKQQYECEYIQLKLNNFHKEQIDRDKLNSELYDINLNIEKSKVDKISDEQYHEIYKKLLEIETKSK